MKDKNFKNVILWITYTIFLLFIMLNFRTVWSMLGKLVEILNPFFYGFVLAFLLNMPYKFFRDKAFKGMSSNSILGKLRIPLALICSYLLIGGVITAIIAILIPELIKSAELLAVNLPSYGRQAERVFNSIFEILRDKFNLLDESSSLQTFANDIFKAIRGGDLSELIDNIISNFFPAAVTTVRTLISEVYNWLVAIIISVYLLISKEKLQTQGKKIIKAYTKPSVQKRIFDIAKLINNKCGKFIIGKIIDSLIIGVICFIGMSLFKFDYALLISVVVAITNIIPVFGPFIGAIPSAFLLLIINPIECLWFVLFVIILQQIDGNIIGPKILGDQIGISSFWIMFSVIIGGGLFGIVGMILGVPIFAVIYCMLGDNVNSRLSKSEQPVDELSEIEETTSESENKD